MTKDSFRQRSFHITQSISSFSNPPPNQFTMSSKLISRALRAAIHARSSALPAEVSKVASAYLSSAPSGGKHVLPDLPYDYAALQRKFCDVVIATAWHRCH
jgi:hypothetical protein